MKKLFIVLMALSMFITGCSSTDNSQTGEETASDYKIALLTDPLGAEKFLLQAYDEFNLVAEEQGFTATHLEATDSTAWTDKARQAATEGYDLVIGIGWQAGGAFSALAEEFPNVKFAVVDTVAENTDVKSIAYNTADGAYVLGVMAANAFPNETLFGYIGNFQDQANFAYRYGFEQGVLSVIPNAEFIVNYADTYSDTAAVYNLAKQQAAAGATFIMGSVSSSANEGLYQAALDLANEGNPIYTTGLSVDQTRSDNPYIIGGLTKDTGISTRLILEEFLAGNFTGGSSLVGFKEDAFGVVHINTGDVTFTNEEIITPEVLEATNTAASAIKNGEIIIEVPLQN